MKFFLGVVPPIDIYRRIQNIQQQYGNNRLEPHITLRPPVTPVHEQEWLNTVTTAIAAMDPFTVQLTGTDFFGSRVLFMSVKSEPLHQLYNLLIPALRIFEPEEAKKGTEKFHPHLTLGRAWCGFTPDDFRGMKHMADGYLSTGILEFQATYIRIYYKPDHYGPWQPYRDVTLGNNMAQNGITL